ncbi:HTTM domain-containing protein [Rubrivirga sp. IMCC45206]|uniref:HTTM domain-containing protein n=1 Tax=Rubrivirga sp. IMCC45206 TaxID=3391614 RepID=UPI003990208B
MAGPAAASDRPRPGSEAGGLRRWLAAPVPIAPLATFRILFGAVMVVSVVRFASNGWIDQLYVQPGFHFAFYGFGWVRPLGEAGMHAAFAVMGLAALGVMLGWRYRWSAAVFFGVFTYVELIDKANYLNHYYFVSVAAGLLVLLPAHRALSLDVRRDPGLAVATVPRWAVDVVRLQLGIVYVFAGLAKLHPEWLLDAMPLRLWLPAHAHLPLVGPLLAEPATAVLFSWGGALYDLTVPFLLLWGRTRALAYAAVVGFHLTTALLFPIGMFPYIMILATLVFFPAETHERAVSQVRRWLGRGRAAFRQTTAHYRPSRRVGAVLAAVFAVHFAVQLVLPLRFLAYPGPLLWTEEGYRFSWRVMLIEKAGHATFEVRDPATGRAWEAAGYEHLTPNQEKMMATQPDMLLQFAHFLEEHYRSEGIADVEVRVRSRVTLNGRRSQLLVDPTVDLTEIDPGLGPKDWILPFRDDGARWVGRSR